MSAGVVLVLHFIFVRKFCAWCSHGASLRITAPAFIGQFLALVATVESQASPCGIFGGHSGTKTCFFPWVIRFCPTVIPEWDSSQAHHSRFSNFEFPFLTSVLETESHLLVLTVSFCPSCCCDWQDLPYNRHICVLPSHLSIHLKQNDNLKMKAVCSFRPSSASRRGISKEAQQICVKEVFPSLWK